MVFLIACKQPLFLCFCWGMVNKDDCARDFPLVYGCSAEETLSEDNFAGNNETAQPEPVICM